jgi:hypothetical protein
MFSQPLNILVYSYAVVTDFMHIIILIFSVQLLSVEKSSAESPQRFEDLCERGK